MQKSGGTSRLFVDEAVIHVRGGRGGDGCVSFRREKYVPKGGPDGGDGGNGGTVYLEAREGLDTLLDLAGHHHWRAENGKPGMGKKRHGRDGTDVIVPVPVGTLVYDDESGRLLKDMVSPDHRVPVARGGRGGKGNVHFVTSTHQAPREYQPGRPGQQRTLRLQLKLIADVGFVGLPNAGKSTLLSRLTRARPKVAPYPFTTREPQLGIAELPDFRRLVLADIPGLIEGAHEGVGLGDAFLRHIERTRVLVHVVDLHPPPGAPAPAEAYAMIRRELNKYSAALAERREIVVANKLDLGADDEALAALHAVANNEVTAISAVTGEGLRALLERIWERVQAARAEQRAVERRTERIDFGDRPDLETQRPTEDDETLIDAENPFADED